MRRMTFRAPVLAGVLLSTMLSLPQDATGLSRGVSRWLLQRRSAFFEMLRACPVVSHAGRYYSDNREPPRDKPVASREKILARVATIVNLHGTSPWHPALSADTQLFREAAAETGLNFHHFTGSTGEFYMPEIMGAGAALFDYDNDGDLDVYLLQGSMLDEKKKPSEAKFPPPKDWKPGNRLFRNELIPSGKLRFIDVTEKAGVGFIGYG